MSTFSREVYLKFTPFASPVEITLTDEWDYALLSQNPNITWEHVKSMPDKPWDFARLSRNPNITWDNVLTCLDKPWDFTTLSRNPTLTFEIISAHPELPWNFNLISKNLFGEDIYFRSMQYQRPIAKRRHDQMYCELIARACRTSRIFSWNEGAADEFPEAYAAECQLWREMRFETKDAATTSDHTFDQE